MRNPKFCALIKDKGYREKPWCPICQRVVHASRCEEKGLNLETQCRAQESDECKEFVKQRSKTEF